jgi:hypothetical protein
MNSVHKTLQTANSSLTAHKKTKPVLTPASTMSAGETGSTSAMSDITKVPGMSDGVLISSLSSATAMTSASALGATSTPGAASSVSGAAAATTQTTSCVSQTATNTTRVLTEQQKADFETVAICLEKLYGDKDKTKLLKAIEYFTRTPSTLVCDFIIMGLSDMSGEIIVRMATIFSNDDLTKKAQDYSTYVEVVSKLFYFIVLYTVKFEYLQTTYAEADINTLAKAVQTARTNVMRCCTGTAKYALDNLASGKDVDAGYVQLLNTLIPTIDKYLDPIIKALGTPDPHAPK